MTVMYSDGQHDGRLLLLKLASGGVLKGPNSAQILAFAEEVKVKEPNEYGQGYYDVVVTYIELAQEDSDVTT